MLKCCFFKTVKITKNMKNRVLDIIKSFSAPEVTKFKHYLRSPYFNRSNKVYLLYSEIINFYPFFDSPQLNYKFLNFKVNPSRPYNAVTMRSLISDLEKHALNFLRQINLDTDEISTHNYLRDELRARSLGRIFEQSIKDYEEKQPKENIIDENYFLNRLNLETDKLNYSYISKNLSKKINVDSLIMYLVTGSKNLFLYFIMKMITHYLNLQTMQANYKEIEERNALYEFLVKFFSGLDNFYLKGFLRDKNNDYYYVFDIYYNLFRAFSNRSGLRNYEKCKELLTEYGKYFKANEKHFLYGKLVDFCELRQKVNPKDEYSRRELVNLYELHIAKKYYETESNPYLPLPLFRNMLNFAIRIRKFKWAEKYIKIYSNKLYPDFKGDLRNLGYARIAFARGQFSETLRKINKVNPDASGIKVDYKNLMIMLHYELGNFMLVESLLDSYKLFIRRSKVISKENKVYYRNFAFYVERFVKFTSNRNKTYLGSLKDRIKKEENIVYKSWLIQKVNELAGSKSKAA